MKKDQGIKEVARRDGIAILAHGQFRNRETQVTIAHVAVLTPKGDMLRRLVERWGMVMARPDGEDSHGRSKVGVMPVEEMVARAADTVDEMYRVIEERGWSVDLPTPLEAENMLYAGEDAGDK